MAGKNGVSINWGGLDNIINNALEKVQTDRKKLLATIGETLVSSTVKRFDEGKDPEGKTWEPSGRAWAMGLAVEGRKATAKRKAVKSKAESGVFGKTLLKTARLRNSIDYATTPDSVLVGTNVEYGRIHQKGGKAGRGRKVNIPQRAYLGISKEDMEEIKHIFSEFMQGIFQKS